MACHIPSAVHRGERVQLDETTLGQLSAKQEAVDAKTGAGVEGLRLQRQTGAIDCDGHFPPAEEPDDQVHDFPDVFDGESGHPAMDDTVPGEHRATGGEALAVFHVGFDAVVSLV